MTKAKIDSGHSAHPHRASAGPACYFVGAPGPTMLRGGGSKLKGLMGRAPYPHADAAFRPIGCPDSADGGISQNGFDMGVFVPAGAMHNYVMMLAVRPAALAKPGGAYHESSAL
jgi:hypothetical protein